MKSTTSQLSIRRGDIFIVDLGTGDEQMRRSVLVIQNDVGNRFGNSVIVTPLITKPRGSRFLFGVEIQAGQGNILKETSMVLLSQIRTIEKSRFSSDNFLGTVLPKTMDMIDSALELSLGLSFIQRLESKQGKSGRLIDYPSKVGSQ